MLQKTKQNATYLLILRPLFHGSSFGHFVETLLSRV